jgi:hypothetical protein
LETDLDKKHKEKLSKLKSSSQDFLQHQKDSMEMISKVTRSIYRLIEKIAEKEIEKDPIAFIREQSMLRPSPQGMREQAYSPSGGGGPDESESFVFDEESKEDGQYEDIKVESDDPISKHSNLYDPDLVEELDEVFKSAYDLIMSTLPQKTPKE